MIEGYYFGRFQPPGKHHGDIVRFIRQSYPDLSLTVGVARSNQGGRTQENFLNGDEARELFKLMLADLQIDGTDVVNVNIDTAMPLVHSVRKFWSTRTFSGDEAFVFSGSPSTIAACREVGNEFPLKVIELQDDDSTGPRARHVRAGLLTSTTDWHDLVTPGVREYLTQEQIINRIRSLPNGTKRPWTKTS